MDYCVFAVSHSMRSLHCPAFHTIWLCLDDVETLLVKKVFFGEEQLQYNRNTLANTRQEPTTA
jgi:hypothetical protein